MTVMTRRLHSLAVAGGLALGGLGLAATPAAAQAPVRTVVPYRAANGYYYYYAPPARAYTYAAPAPAYSYSTTPRYIGNFNKRYPDWSTDRPVPMAKPWMRPLR
jgi:hypothetical protein